MEFLYFVVGLIIIGFVYYDLSRKIAKRNNCTTDAEKVRSEVWQAKRDVEMLIIELNKLSDRVVRDFEAKINATREELENFLKGEAANAKVNKEEEIEEQDSQMELPFPEAKVKPVLQPDKYKQIYDLADKGLTVHEIAQQIQMGKGEVALILQLKNKNDAKNSESMPVN